jgi:hypothetical protein
MRRQAVVASARLEGRTLALPSGRIRKRRTTRRGRNPDARFSAKRSRGAGDRHDRGVADAIVRPASRGRINAIARAHLAKVQRFEAMIGEYVGAGSAAACRRVPPR